MDAFGAALLLVATSPILAAAALMVRHDLGSPVFFTQGRPGKDGRMFRLYKFRSMKDVDAAAGLLKDEDRLTDLGRLLRSTSLDELPSLVNVLRGDMSFVGPRPLLMRYLDLYTSEQARRHEVRPGITGLAQVSGRNRLEWEDRFALDIQYVDNFNFTMDLKILIRTVSSVLHREGITADGEATMREFQGTAAERIRA